MYMSGAEGKTGKLERGQEEWQMVAFPMACGELSPQCQGGVRTGAEGREHAPRAKLRRERTRADERLTGYHSYMVN